MSIARSESASGCSTSRTWASCSSKVPDAGEALAAAVVSDPPALAVGRAHYSMICAPNGGIIDDLIIYRLAEDRFLVVANAANAQVVSDALAERLAGSRAVLDDQSLATGLVAVQGPRSVDVLAPLTDVDLGRLALLRHRRGLGGGHPRPCRHGPGTRARTGSRSSSRPRRTGELWDALLDAVRGAGGGPSGWAPATRSVSRPGMPLYGNELDLTTTPFDAGLGRVVKLDKPGDFVGRAALEKVAVDGPQSAPGRSDRRGPRDRPPRLPGACRLNAARAS